VQLDQLSGSVNQLNEDVEIAFHDKLMAENSDREMAEFRSAILFSRQKIVTCGSI